MLKNIVLAIKRFVTNIKNRIKQWSKPTTIKLAAEALTDLQRIRCSWKAQKRAQSSPSSEAIF